MKTIKKVVAVLVAAVMIMAMGITAFAEEATVAAGKGSLTVKVQSKNNTLNQQTIKLYKLFDLTVSGEGDHAKYGYTVSAEYKDILKEVLQLPGDATDIDYYEAVSSLEAVDAFAKSVSEKILTAGKNPTADSGKITEEVAEYQFNDLPYGYYLVHQTGTSQLQSSLVSVSAALQEVELKGLAPVIQKKSNVETAEIGQLVTYTVDGKIPDTTGYDQYVYKIKDTMTKGLDFVQKDGSTVEGAILEVTVSVGESSEKVSATLSGEGNRTMVIDLSEWVRTHQAEKGQTFTVTYYAKQNQQADVTEKNSATLEYGNNPNDVVEGKPSIVPTPTYPLNINKTDSKTTMLAGASFRLYRDLNDAKAANDNAIKMVGENGQYTVAADQTTGNMDVVSVKGALEGGNYNLQINGLAAGTYYLVETKAPDGYNKLSEPITVTFTKSATEDENEWTVSKNNTEVPDKILDIQNKAGTLLPETGGMGTILFTVIAVILIAGVAISFVVSRRKER